VRQRSPTHTHAHRLDPTCALTIASGFGDDLNRSRTVDYDVLASLRPPSCVNLLRVCFVAALHDRLLLKWEAKSVKVIQCAAFALMLCAGTALATERFAPGDLGNLQFVNPKLNPGYMGQNDPGRRYAIVARARISADRASGVFIDPNGAPAGIIDLSTLPASELAALRDQCPDYVFCVARWEVELTARQDPNGLMVVNLYSWRR
jgi:hypothetical protein